MESAPSHNLPVQLALWPEGTLPFAGPEDGELPRLTLYRPSAEYRTGQTVLILPGGGYQRVSTEKEGHRPAMMLASRGHAAAVLEYRHSPARHPVPLADAQRAMKLLRSDTRTSGLDPGAIGVMGFSAGGHLAGLLATQPPVSLPCAPDAVEAESGRPAFAALIYPVASFCEPFSHAGSREALLGPDAEGPLRGQLSLERAVSESTPPMFIAHGQADESVPPENALSLYTALCRASVPADLHIYHGAGHGFGLGDNHVWGRDLLEWLATLPVARGNEARG